MDGRGWAKRSKRKTKKKSCFNSKNQSDLTSEGRMEKALCELVCANIHVFTEIHSNDFLKSTTEIHPRNNVT